MKLQLDQLESCVQTLSSESTSRVKKLREDLVRDIDIMITQKIPDASASNDGMDEIKESLENIKSSMTKSVTIRREAIFLEKMYFSSIDQRERTVDSAEEGTFQWVFNATETHMSQRGWASSQDPVELREVEYVFEEGDYVFEDGDSVFEEGGYVFEGEELERQTQARDLFIAWLHSGNGVFHISGKAGSGKSTLMKFLCSQRRTEIELSKWAKAQGKELVFAPFYFWRSNNELQMSLDGLYRSILFVMLKKCPELTPILFPAQWKWLEHNSEDMPPDFVTSSVVEEAFQTLTTKKTFPNHRFCLFIDGLDEYHGETLEHVKLVERLQLWADGGNIKICASSRPYLEYENLALPSTQRIHLHDLTRHDIYRFSRQMMEKDINFKQISDSYLGLVYRIATMSEGIFLWARLVVNSLLIGMMRHDNVRTLEKKLEIVPRKLNDLYRQLLESLDDDDRERAIKMLLLTVHNPLGRLLNSMMYTWIDDLADPDFPCLNGTEIPSWPSAEKITEDAQCQIRGLTKGLLETTSITESWLRSHTKVREVQFFHRTVRDFVVDQLESMQQSEEYCDLFKVDTYYRLRLAEMIASDEEYNDDYFAWIIYHCKNSSEKIFPKGLSLSIIDGFYNVMSSINSARPDGSMGTFSGCSISFHNSRLHTGHMSFIHLAAYTGQREYVMREIEKDPRLLKEMDGMTILASAMIGLHVDFARDLVERGCSLVETICILLERLRFHNSNDISIPVWLAVLIQDVGNGITAPGWEVHFDLLDFLLGDQRVKAKNCIFLLSKIVPGPVTHFITLKQIIEQSRPVNMDRLLSNLQQNDGNSSIKTIERHHSDAVFRESPRKLSPDDQILDIKPYRLVEGKPILLMAVFCDDFKVRGQLSMLRVF